MKTCSKCKLSKDTNEFYKDKYKKDGFSCHCKECIKEYSNRPDVKQHNKEYIKEYGKGYRDRPEVKQRNKEYNKKYYKEYLNRPKVKQHKKEYYKERGIIQNMV